MPIICSESAWQDGYTAQWKVKTEVFRVKAVTYRLLEFFHPRDKGEKGHFEKVKKYIRQDSDFSIATFNIKGSWE